MDMEQGKGAGHEQHRGSDMTARPTPRMPIAEIIIGKRHRTDLGDVKGLARSIREIGLLHPIAVRPDGVLIAGERRLAAYKLLGISAIPVRVINLDQVLSGELAENTCRKDLRPSEIVAVGRAIQELEREKARQRQIELGKSRGDPSGKFPEGSQGRTHDKIAAVLGVSGKTYEKAVKIVEAAEEGPERFGHLVEEMDRINKVDGPYRKLCRAQEEERLRTLDGAIQQGPHAADARRMRRISISLPATAIDALVRKGLLPQQQRHDANALRGALTDLLLRALEEPRDVVVAGGPDRAVDARAEALVANDANAVQGTLKKSVQERS